jgi:hypothetical protein
MGMCFRNMGWEGGMALSMIHYRKTGIKASRYWSVAFSKSRFEGRSLGRHAGQGLGIIAPIQEPGCIIPFASNLAVEKFVGSRTYLL